MADETGKIAANREKAILGWDRINSEIRMVNVDATGRLKIVGFDSEAVYIDDADWTDSSSSHILVGGLYQSTPQTITDGDVGPFQVDANGRMLVSLSSDIQIGSVELKDADSAALANIKAANTGRSTATVVLAVQAIDAAGAVLDTSSLATSAGQLADGHNVTIDNAAGSAVYVQPGTSASFAVTVASGGIASGGIAAGAIASGAAVSGAFADGAIVTLGAKTDAKSTATDATSITIMQVLKEISYMEQTPASRAVTNGGTFAVQVDGTALTALQLIDDAIYVDDADWVDSTSKHMLVGGLYQSTPQTITDGDVGPLEVDANGNLKTTLATLISGEDQTNDVLKTEQQFTPTYVAAAGADNVIKASAGFLHSIILGKWVTGGTVEVSDHASDGDGNVKIFLQSGAVDESGFPKTILVNAKFAVGITADLIGTTNVTFIWR